MLFRSATRTTTLTNSDGKKTIKLIPSRFETNDRLILKAKEFINKTEVDTTVGRFIFNKFLIEGKCEEILGYVNTVLRKGDVGKLANKLGDEYAKDALPREVLVRYLNDFQWLSMRLHSICCSSFTENTFKPLPEVIKLRDELMEEYKEEIAAGDAIAFSKVEKACIAKAKEILKDDPGMMLYDSGARGSFEIGRAHV